MSAPDVRQAGDEIQYAFRDDNVGLRFSQIRVTESGTMYAHLEAYSVRADNPGPIWWQRVQLTAQTDRVRLAEKLAGFARTDKKAWERDIDTVFQDCARRHLALPSPIVLADVEAPLDTQYLIKPVVMLNQVNMLLADQGSTKSYLLLYLAVCIAAGIESCFGMPKLKGPVILFDWETDESAQNKRLAWICNGLKIAKPRDLLYMNMGDRGRIMDRGGDMRAMIAQTGAVAAIIDSLTFGAGGNLNDTEISAPTMSTIGSLGAGVTKLVTAHPAKSSRSPKTSDAEVSAIGSGLFEFRPRSIWRMKAPRPNERGNSFVVSMTQRKISEDMINGTLFYRVTFDAPSHATRFEASDATHAPAPESGDGKSKTQGDKFLDFLAGRPYHQANTPELARALNLDAGQVRAVGGRLVTKGKVMRLGGSDDSGTTVWQIIAQASSNGVSQADEDELEEPEGLIEEQLPWG